MLTCLAVLLLSARVALAGPTLQAAPAEPPRPEVAAPLGGWWTEDGLYARVHAAPEDMEVARGLAAHAAESVPRLAARLGLTPGGRLDVYVAPSQESFVRLQPGAPPDWADGTAWPQHGLVFLRAPSVRGAATEPLAQVLDHEIVHVLVGRAFAEGGARGGPPRWLQEGLAQWMSGEHGPEVGRTLSSGGVIPLAELTRGFPADPIRARLAYAASVDFVAFVAQEWGEAAVRDLVRRMARGADVEEALAGATGEGFSSVEAAWRADWADPVFWARLVQVSGEAVWVLAALGIVVGAFRVRRRNRARLDRWEQEEELARLLAEARAQQAAQAANPWGEPYHHPLWSAAAG
jgi:hypothetical protein